MSFYGLVDGSDSSLRNYLKQLPGVDQVGAEARAAMLATRSIKTTSKAWAIDTAITLVDLTTLEGADTPAWWLAVHDNGTGFAPEHAHRLFEPFLRLHDKQKYPGAGLGLATSQRLAQGLGGSLRAEGRPNEGASFTLSLSLLQGQAVAAAPTALDQEKFDTEREVVKNERRQSYENVPYGLAEETILANLYPAELRETAPAALATDWESALEGEVDRLADLVHLRGDVRVVATPPAASAASMGSGGPVHFSGEGLRIDTRQRIVSSDEPVLITQDHSQIRAQSIIYNDQTRIAELGGRVKGVYQTAQRRPAVKGSP